jgi:hypothetical protein
MITPEALVMKRLGIVLIFVVLASPTGPPVARVAGQEVSSKEFAGTPAKETGDTQQFENALGWTWVVTPIEKHPGVTSNTIKSFLRR